ncbi:short chain dehydrogenase [Rhizoctonia solani]|uniref:Short chain dehydrogenase n=1 Tax=Rhizoctonia solani TaxID=456999 RepID=A0A8H8NNU7_9AGAM|nr:short chain dehydrogenase [Rhizoctonia solani]QRW16705.1 short chain dehydrogenase [Rhizoctonia solani]
MPIANLSGKVIIITGANLGIGLEAARALADMGAQIVLACCDKSKGEEARKEIIKSTGNLNVELEILDCGSFASLCILGQVGEEDFKKDGTSGVVNGVAAPALQDGRMEGNHCALLSSRHSEDFNLVLAYWEGAINVVWLSIAPEPVTPGMEGLLWACKVDVVKTWTLDLQLQDELWDIWCKETDAPLL